MLECAIIESKYFLLKGDMFGQENVFKNIPWVAIKYNDV